MRQWANYPYRLQQLLLHLKKVELVLMILSDQRVHTVHCIFDYDLFIFAKETHKEQTMASCLHLFYLTKGRRWVMMTVYFRFSSFMSFYRSVCIVPFFCHMPVYESGYFINLKTSFTPKLYIDIPKIRIPKS